MCTFSKSWEHGAGEPQCFRWTCALLAREVLYRKGALHFEPSITWITPDQSLHPKVLCKIWIMYMLPVYFVLWRRKHPFLLLLEARPPFWFQAYCLYEFGITTPFTPCVSIRLWYRSNMLMLLILAEMLVTYFKVGCNNTNSCNSFAFLHRNYVVHSENNKHPAFL